MGPLRVSGGKLPVGTRTRRETSAPARLKFFYFSFKCWLSARLRRASRLRPRQRDMMNVMMTSVSLPRLSAEGSSLPPGPFFFGAVSVFCHTRRVIAVLHSETLSGTNDSCA